MTTTRPELIDHLYALSIPRRFTSADLITATHDAQILLDALRDRGAEIAAAAQCVLDGDEQAGYQRLAANGLLEKDYEDQGGGFLALVVLIILLYATNAY